MAEQFPENGTELCFARRPRPRGPVTAWLSRGFCGPFRGPAVAVPDQPTKGPAAAVSARCPAVSEVSCFGA
jgi:hypothetical protein